MKNFAYFIMCSSLFLLASCSSKAQKEKEQMLLLMKDSTGVEAPQQMQVSDAKQTYTYNGKEYQSSVVRRPDESLPLVSDGMGKVFVDNRITLRITCAGKQVVDRVFTKESFASLVEAKFMKYAILEGMVYDKNTPQGMIYATSVSYPQSDLYIPIKLTVASDGKISMERDDLIEVCRVDSVY